LIKEASEQYEKGKVQVSYFLTQNEKGGTIEKTYDMFKEGLSIKQIAETRNLATSTITGHLESLIKNGRDIEIDRLIDPAKRNTIKEIFVALKTWNTVPIVEHSKGTVSGDDEKLVRAWGLCSTKNIGAGDKGYN
jgi:ATP-dependent DNA helicase RecQ